MPPLNKIKIYHIVHVDRLASILEDNRLLCDAMIAKRAEASQNHDMGTAIGINAIKHRRRTQCKLSSYPSLYVGKCVPFYFCPRSVMLYVIHKGNHPELAYHGGQDPILHLEANLQATVAWAEKNQRRWAFTLSNAGSFHFQDRADLAQLNEIDWDAIKAQSWQHCMEEKQAEFLIERSFPWKLVTRIGVRSQKILRQAAMIITGAAHKPRIKVKPDWYY